MYAYKAAGLSRGGGERSQPGNIPYRPAMFSIDIGPWQHLSIQSMQELGMTTLGMDKTFFEKTLIKSIPDMFGKNDAEIAKIPPFVQYFKCEDKVEKGDRKLFCSLFWMCRA